MNGKEEWFLAQITNDNKMLAHRNSAINPICSTLPYNHSLGMLEKREKFGKNVPENPEIWDC